MSAAALLWRATSGGALAHQPGRSLLAVAAIALGVGLGYAVALVNASAVDEFGSALRTLSGQADLEVRGPRNGFDEEAYARVARDPDVAVASPVVEVDARLAGRDEALRIIGIDAFRAAGVTAALIGEADDPLDLLRPGRLFVTSAAAQALGVAKGDTVDVQAGLATVPLVVAGMVPGAQAQRFGVMDIAAAQDTFARVGKLSRIDVRLRPGASADTVQARLAAALPAGTSIASPDANADATLRMSRAYRVNLDVLALVALLTGGLLVFSTQTLSITRRRGEIALLRALGVTRGGVVRRLVAEGALMGVAGSLAGLVAGHALAAVVLRTVGGDLGAGYFRGVAPQLVPSVPAALAYLALGVSAAALASLVPARVLARSAPAAALKAGARDDAFVRLDAPRVATALVAAGVACAFLPSIEGLPIAGYVAMALLLAGTLLALPSLASALLAAIPLPRAVPPALALARLRATPQEAGVSLAAIVASIALMVSMAIMVASFRTSLTAWLHSVLPADVYVRAAGAGDTGFFSPDDQRRMAHVPGVAGVAFSRMQSVAVAPDAPRASVLARDLPARDPAQAFVLVGDSHVPRADDPPPAWISERVADAMRARPGERIALALAGSSQPFTVAGVFRDYARQQGSIVIDRTVYTRITGDGDATEAAVTLAAGTTPAAFEHALRTTWPESAGMTLATPGELRAISLAIFDRTFAVTYALLAVAIVIGLAGLSSAFGASIVTRRREFGTLRHVGMTRRQIAAMLVTEGTALTALGLVAGLVLGAALAVILVHVVNRQSFHWSMDMSLPWPLLAVLACGLLVAAAVTSLASARQALRQDAIVAVKDDW